MGKKKEGKERERHRRAVRKAKAQAKKAVGKKPKGHAAGSVVTLHFNPSDLAETETSHLGVLFAQLAQAYELGCALPGITWPVHITVEFNGTRVCGTVEPGSGELPEGIIIDPPEMAEA